MYTAGGLLRHYGDSLKRIVIKKIWRDRVFFALWPVLSVLLKVVALSSKEVTPFACHTDRAVVLTGTQDSFESGRVPGQNLTDLAARWLGETIGFKQVRLADSLEHIPEDESPDTVLVTHDWLLENYQHPIRSALRLFRHLSRLRSPVFVILADGFWLRVTALGSLLVALAGGSQILLQDTVASHSKFGTLRTSGPHFWTWPPSHLRAWESGRTWAERSKRALIAGTGGGAYRRRVGEEIEPRLVGWSYQTTRTSFGLSWESYIQLNKESRIIVTTCKMHPDYFRGPLYYRRRIPILTATGRVWEAFASGNLLITDRNPVLEELGFKAGEHYLPLPDDVEAGWEKWSLPEDETLSSIASQGRKHFESCVLKAVRPSTS